MEIPLKSDGRPNINRLLEAIENEVIKSVKEKGFQMPAFIPHQVELEPEQSAQHSEFLKFLNHHWNDWSLPLQFNSHRPVIGKLIVKFKNIFQKLVRLCLQQYFDRELRYQENLVRYLNQSSKYIDRRDANIFWSLNKKVDNEVAAVNTRTDELFEKLANEVLTLKEKLKKFEKID